MLPMLLIDYDDGHLSGNWSIEATIVLTSRFSVSLNDNFATRQLHFLQCKLEAGYVRMSFVKHALKLLDDVWLSFWVQLVATLNLLVTTHKEDLDIF